MSDDPVRDELRAAMKALLAGDTKGRDDHVARAKRIMDAMEEVPKLDLSREQIVDRLVSIGAQIMGRPLSAAMEMTIRNNPVKFMLYLQSSGYSPSSSTARS